MKTLKKIGIGFLLFLLISSIGGYFYFKDAFKAPKNLVHVSGESSEINLSWNKGKFSDREGLFIPVKLPYAKETYYMQFDLGAVYSVTYNTAIQSIRKKYDLPDNTEENYFKEFSLELGNLNLKYDSIKNLDFGKSIDWEDTVSKKIIGTIGADFIEKVKAIIDFKNSKAYFSLVTLDSLKNNPLATSFEFKERKILIPSKINGISKKLMWDTGASAYDLITSKDNWEQMALNKESIKPHDANQLKRKLKVYTAKSDAQLSIGDSNLNLNTVTYIEGFPWYVELAMQFSGMEGMIGNNLFKNSKIFIDVKNEDLIIFQ